MNNITGWLVFPFPYGPPLAVYVVLQIVALLKTSGKWRLAIALPIPIIIISIVLTVLAYRQDSNLWPMIVIFANAISLLYLVFLWIASRISNPKIRVIFILIAALFPLSLILTLPVAVVVLVIGGLLYSRHMKKEGNA